MQRKLMFVFGTRPEAIKMAPLIIEAKKACDKWNVKIVVTGQHKEMVAQVMSFFGLTHDYDLELMKSSQTLFDISTSGLKLLRPILEKEKPDVVLVQGDTTTAFVGALAAFYLKTTIAHIEAGLRSGDKRSPFPEEANRKFISSIADFHFAPTAHSEQNLARESILENVFVVGNTVIDSLHIVNKAVQNDLEYSRYFSFVKASNRVILVTAHRRESFGKPLEAICRAIVRILEQFKDVEVVFPVHPNPAVRDAVYKSLGKVERAHLIEPLDYPYLIWIINRSYLILSDSGGIQEEAPALGKPVLVMREVTERIEGIEAGTAKLVGTDENHIFNATSSLLSNKVEYDKMSVAINPYGDGKASYRILDILSNSPFI